MTKLVVYLAVVTCLAGHACAAVSPDSESRSGNQVTNHPVREATPEQMSALRTYTNSGLSLANGVMGALIEDPANDGLALEVVKMLENNMPKSSSPGDTPMWWVNLSYFLSCRAYGPLLVGEQGPAQVINDGPYLSRFVRVLLRRIKQELEVPPSFPYYLMTEDRCITPYLEAHPEDREFREEARQLASEYARVSEGRNVRQCYISWAILLALGDIHAGMTAEEAKRILGPPTTASEGRLLWMPAHPPGMHVEPGPLTAELTGDIVKAFSKP